MSELLEMAVVLNGGRRRDALCRIADTLGVTPDTVRRWQSGKRPIPQAEMVALRALVENKVLKAKIERVIAVATGE